MSNEENNDTVQPSSEDACAANEASGKTTETNSENTYEKREIVAEWRVPLAGKLHKIEFEHGTTSGKRVIWVDEKVLSAKVPAKGNTLTEMQFFS